MISHGFHSPDSRLCVINDLICWYNGLKVGDGEAAGAGAESPAPGCPGPPAPVGFALFAWFDVMARISSQTALFRPLKFRKTSVLYKTYDTV
jgi:hypothetical protein